MFGLVTVLIQMIHVVHSAMKENQTIMTVMVIVVENQLLTIVEIVH